MTSELHGVRVLECSAEGAELGTENDAVELMSGVGTARQLPGDSHGASG
jgi:hypothetical protein